MNQDIQGEGGLGDGGGGMVGGVGGIDDDQSGLF